jgi:hypothetical protein
VQLGISLFGLPNSLNAVVDKLNIRSIAALAKYAIQEGLTSEEL